MMGSESILEKQGETTMTKILFQGDSLTDACRDKEEKDVQKILGIGYVNMAAAYLTAHNPKITVMNHGVNGNRIMDLYARWIEDTLNVDFDILSVLCGINDVGFDLRLHKGADAEKFAFIYDRMLYEVKQAKPDAKLVLCEPFLFKLDPDDVGFGYSTDIVAAWDTWYGRIRENAAVVDRLAEKYGAVLVPSLKLFEDACQKAPAAHWSLDGIHLSRAGNALLAELWIDCVKEAGYVQV